MSKKDKSAPVYQLTPEKTLTSLLSLTKRTQKQITELAGEMGASIANACEHKHLHRKAFNITKGLHRMTDEKLHETLEHLDHYLEATGIRERAAKVERLPLDDDDKVVPFKEAAE